jgi:hypothetical protein
MNITEKRVIILDNIKNLMKEDIWRIINGEETPKRDFFSYVLSLLITKKKILLRDVVDLSKRLNNRYVQILGEVNDYIAQGNGEVLPALRRLDKEFVDKVLPILKEIDRIKKL